jgi:hypothetical protein
MLFNFLTGMYTHVKNRDIKAIRAEMKKSPYKILLRVFLLLQFSAIFTHYFINDIGDGYFTWAKVLTYILLFLPIGFLMSFIVPMRPSTELQAVTFSLDKIYLFLIWLLVIMKLLASYYYHTESVADLIMAMIIGLMGGRLAGIVLRVRNLNLKHNFI